MIRKKKRNKIHVLHILLMHIKQKIHTYIYIVLSPYIYFILRVIFLYIYIYILKLITRRREPYNV